MPRRDDIKTILIIGAGPIVIGQACEFDYSGTQAVTTLREEGYRVVLINSNPATIMTDPELADATYIEPITPEYVEKIIIKEKPDALLPTMGGQTALNCAKALAEAGTLEKHGVQLIGAQLASINKAEDRRLFAQAMDKIGLLTPKSGIAHSLDEARDLLEYVGLPAVIRPSFTMGGSGGGIAYNKEEFEKIILSGLDASPTNEVLIDESVLGWKEYEMEVVRDKADNCIIICSIENIDPMGVHTGDSITVAPAMTLSDKEYQVMRNASIAVLREIGVDTGGSNVQFAINPKDGRMVVIEMNPRVSRSSALASKATGFPIAKVAAKLAVGYTLDEIMNEVTGSTPASFEPSIDYIVTKIPRFTFEKFDNAEPNLTTAMKSVGEAMAMGRNFPESLQKAMRSLETGLNGLDPIHIEGASKENHAPIEVALTHPTPDRLRVIGQALRFGVSPKTIHRLTHYDPWFVDQLVRIIEAEKFVQEHGLPADAESFRAIKALGFSDLQLAELTKKTEAEIYKARMKLGVAPVYKRVDTCAAEFASNTAYLYSSYEKEARPVGCASHEQAERRATERPAGRTGRKMINCEAAPDDREKIIILGGGPNRIGQGIEFDYCCVHAAYALGASENTPSYQTIMINCNPETVSTDYDTADKLYFEPLTAEDVLAIIHREQENGTIKGVIVQFGGQTPLKLAKALTQAGIPIIGTSVDAIDLAEDRERFQKLLHQLKLKQPPNAICHHADDAVNAAKRIGYPVVVRPSYVLGGRAMRIIYSEPVLVNYLQHIAAHFGDGPILLDGFLQDATELDVDCLCDGENTFVASIMEHIEEAGIHSGDSACSLPPYSLPNDLINAVRVQTIALAKALKIIGLMNVQFAVKDNEIYVIEVNPRASRTVPFVAKTIGIPIAKIAAQLMAGAKLADFDLPDDKTHMQKLGYIAVKEVVFPFARFDGVDTILGPEMKSTGETMGIDRDFATAFAKGFEGTNAKLPQSGTVFISVKDSDKDKAVALAKKMIALGFDVLCTRGTAYYLKGKGLVANSVHKVCEGRPHVVDYLKDGKIDLVFNTTLGEEAIADSASIRREALMRKISYATTMEGADAMAQAIASIRAKEGGFDVTPLQEYQRSA
jgi:carbamoyl-phosphate synthase large subunit